MGIDLDWSALENQTVSERTKYSFKDVEHLVYKVAFDQYKPLSGSDTLWELREEDGKKFLYAVYDKPEDLTIKSQSGWDAISDRDGKNITLSYKAIPIMRFASTEHGFDKEEAADFAFYLKKKAANEVFVKELIAGLPSSKRELLVQLLNGSKA